MNAVYNTVASDRPGEGKADTMRRAAAARPPTRRERPAGGPTGTRRGQPGQQYKHILRGVATVVD